MPKHHEQLNRTKRSILNYSNMNWLHLHHVFVWNFQSVWKWLLLVIYHGKFKMKNLYDKLNRQTAFGVWPCSSCAYKYHSKASKYCFINRQKHCTRNNFLWTEYRSAMRDEFLKMLMRDFLIAGNFSINFINNDFLIHASLSIET